MSKPTWIPGPSQTVWAYEQPDEALTSTLWDETDPYLVGLWERGQVFASMNEALAAQIKERAKRKEIR